MRLRAMEGEDLAAAGLRVEQVRELRLDAGGLVQKGERASVRRERIREAFAVSLGLTLHAREGPAFRLSLNRARRRAIGVEQVIHRTTLQGELANCDSRRRVRIRGRAILNEPTSIG